MIDKQLLYTAAQELGVMLDDTAAQGFVPTRALGDEWFVFDEDRLCLIGESTGVTFRLGQRVAVEVADVDIPRGRIDLTLARSSRSRA